MSAIGTVQNARGAESPYVGLTFYTEENAAMFFGRDRERTVLISNLRAARLTLLYAPSGAGKSSLLRAGVASKLTEIAQRNLRQRGAARNIPVVFSSWRDDPLAELIDKIQAASLPFLRGAPPPRLAPGRLDEAIEAASLATDATLLVILDQFEEYFVYRSREVRNRSFADELADCVRPGWPPRELPHRDPGGRVLRARRPVQGPDQQCLRQLLPSGAPDQGSRARGD